MLTQERLKYLFHYNPDTGEFTRLVGVGPTKRGDVLTHVNARGYMYVMIDGKKYLLHRLAWLYVHGVWPAIELDHEDTNPSNNRLCNLREATRKQNGENRNLQSNNKSGFRGVCLNHSKWLAQITHCGRNIKLGRFNTPEEASAAYEDARNRLFTHHK